MIIDENQLLPAHNIWVQPKLKNENNKNNTLNINRPKWLLLKASSYLSIGYNTSQHTSTYPIKMHKSMKKYFDNCTLTFKKKLLCVEFFNDFCAKKSYVNGCFCCHTNINNIFFFYRMNNFISILFFASTKYLFASSIFFLLSN